MHAELDLLDRLGLLEVATDPPVLLRRFDDLVVDPPAVGRLQQRMVEEEAEPPARRRARGQPRRSPRRPRRCARRRDRRPRHRSSDRGTADSWAAAREYSGPATFDGDADLVPRRIDAGDQLDAVEARRQPADLTLSAADVEHPRRSEQFGTGERQDLFVVLGIGAGGEPVDPPLGVLLPERQRCSAAAAAGRPRSPAHVTQRARVACPSDL